MATLLYDMGLDFVCSNEEIRDCPEQAIGEIDLIFGSGETIEFMRNRLYDMCITFLNNVYVNNKTVYDKKSIHVYVEIQKVKTVCAGLQHVRCAGIVSSVG